MWGYFQEYPQITQINITSMPVGRSLDWGVAQRFSVGARRCPEVVRRLSGKSRFIFKLSICWEDRNTFMVLQGNEHILSLFIVLNLADFATSFRSKLLGVMHVLNEKKSWPRHDGTPSMWDPRRLMATHPRCLPSQ